MGGTPQMKARDEKIPAPPIKVRRGFVVAYVGDVKKATIIVTVVVVLLVLVVILFSGRHPIFR